MISLTTVLLSSVHAASADHFVTTWKTDNPGASNSSSITIATTGFGYNYDVDWDNDGVFDQIGITGAVEHDFGTPGTYTIRIQGSFPRIDFSNPATGGDREKIVAINQWGTGSWTGMDYAFWRATNLTSAAADAPNLTNVTNMTHMFDGATIFNGDLSDWDVSNVANMQFMFADAAAFNSDLSAWDVSSVTDMAGMFSDAESFNADLSAWNTANVTNMSNMFYSNAGFNGNISTWNVSNVTNMAHMFIRATAFAGDLSAWDVGNVTNMQAMFQGASVFRSDLSTWDVSSVTSMRGMLSELPVFDSDLSSWNVSNVTDMADMFRSAESFDSNLASWNVSNVTDMEYLFDRSGISIANYDATLIGWSSQSLQSDVNFGGEYIVYCEAADARQSIIDTYGWVITGDVNCLDIAEKKIDAVSFGYEEDKYLMTITGTGLVGEINPNELSEVISRSFVTFNNVPLPMCTFAGLTEQDFIDAYGMPPELISEMPACYQYSADGVTANFTSTQVRVWIPSEFDATAPGAVSVNGSPTLSFNQPPAVLPPSESPVTVNPPAVIKIDNTHTVPQVAINRSSIVAPIEEDISDSDNATVATVAIDGNILGDHTVIDARPTFTGKAPAGSKVTVTVYSDPVTCSTVAGGDGNWSCTLAEALPGGDHTVYLAVVTPENETYKYGPYNVTVGTSDNNPAATDQPQKSNTIDNKKEMSFIPFIVGGGVLAVLIASIIIVKRLRH